MQYPRELKVLPVAAQRRGRPPIGFGLQVADGLGVELPESANQPLVRCTEATASRTIGVLEVDVFAAGMVVDPEGALQQIASAALDRLRGGGTARARPPTAFELDDGVHGIRVHADLLRDGTGQRPALPYLTVVALAGVSVRGGVIVTMASAAANWEAGDRVLDSLRVLDRDRAGGRGGMPMPITGG
ncbi:MAG TPA: hypothetical protein VHE35_00730 [Kofleriaceae bacterium]|nr:hypothetical protein [Kofleriaceae bacterium]